MWIVLGAACIGLSLGMLGSGGSILALPILTYLVGQPEKLAIASSLAVVGGISVIGAIPYVWKRLVDWRSVAWFGVPGMLGSWLGAMAAQGLPGAIQLLIFSAVMLAASLRMIAAGRSSPAMPRSTTGGVHSVRRLAGAGLLVGMMTGIIGIGGGFLIVPALVLLVGLTMQRAVGTSLAVIAANAFIGFAKYAAALGALHLRLDWHVIGMFVALGAIGTIAGHGLGCWLPQQRLKQLFGIVLIGISVYTFSRELPKLW
ncbi:MAG: sulfite exporter TauE/SafE family protein [Steroidobacteraceae bacterium]